MATILEHTPLNVASTAIRTCWQSFDKSDNGGEKDLELIERIGRKYKHASTLEHVTIFIDVEDNMEAFGFFNKNEFSRCIKGTVFITNLRVLLENKEYILNLLPDLINEDFGYLLRDDKAESWLPENVKMSEIQIADKKVSLLFKSHTYNGITSYTMFIKNVSRALLQEIARHRKAGISVKSSRYTLKELRKEKTIIPKMDILCNAIRETVFGKTPKLSEETFRIAEKYLVFTGNDAVDIRSIYALNELQKSIKEGIGNDLAKYSMPEAYKTEFTWTIDTKYLNNFLDLRLSKAALWEIRDLSKDIQEVL